MSWECVNWNHILLSDQWRDFQMRRRNISFHEIYCISWPTKSSWNLVISCFVSWKLNPTKCLRDFLLQTSRLLSKRWEIKRLRDWELWGSLLNNRNGLSVKNMALLYKQLFRSVTDYACPIWRSAALTPVRKLLVLHCFKCTLVRWLTGKFTRIWEVHSLPTT